MCCSAVMCHSQNPALHLAVLRNLLARRGAEGEALYMDMVAGRCDTHACPQGPLVLSGGQEQLVAQPVSSSELARLERVSLLPRPAFLCLGALTPPQLGWNCRQSCWQSNISVDTPTSWMERARQQLSTLTCTGAAQALPSCASAFAPTEAERGAAAVWPAVWALSLLASQAQLWPQKGSRSSKSDDRGQQCNVYCIARQQLAASTAQPVSSAHGRVPGALLTAAPLLTAEGL